MSLNRSTSSLFIFGYGHIGAALADLARAAGYAIHATARSADKRESLENVGIKAVDPADPKALRQAASADAMLITPAPGDDGCPAFAATSGLDRLPPWIGYLSTTGVYGDRGGGWVFEDSELRPNSAEGRRRVIAEQQWLGRGAQVFRLPGLYGADRNVLLRLRDGTARRVDKPGHVFSRLHHDDCATALMASLNRPRSGGIYNLCDDEPASPDDVLVFGAELMGLPLPGFTEITPAMARFYGDNKRVSNALAKAELGWALRYPTYREGLRALYAPH